MIMKLAASTEINTAVNLMITRWTWKCGGLEVRVSSIMDLWCQEMFDSA
ncbi:hypothetical protein [Micromonospora sp. DT227]